MPIIENGLNISASVGRGSRVAESFTPTESRTILSDAHDAYLRASEEMGPRQINHLEMNIPMKI